MSAESYYFDFEPGYFSLPKLVNLELLNVILENLTQINQVDAVLGLTMIQYDGKQPLVFSADETKFNYLKTLGEIITSLEPVSYFKDLSRYFEFKGLGHLNFEDFDLYIVKIANNMLLTIIAIESTSQVFKICQNFADQLYMVFNYLENANRSESDISSTRSTSHKLNGEISSFERYSNETNERKQKKSTTPSKSDLKKLLKEKLDEMGSK